MNIPNWFLLKSENPQKITNEDLKKIHEIEQDMWAEWIWEYVKCVQCSKVFWKNDIFWHLEKAIYQETVWKIEKILNINSIKCKCCGWDTDFIWWEYYLKEIQERYNDEKTFLTTLRDNNGEICGFTDGYINDFDTIYEREFKYYYSNIWKNEIKKRIKTLISLDLPNTLLMNWVVALDTKYSNIQTFLAIIEQFYHNLLKLWYNDIIWIYEANIWDTAHSIYHIFWWKRILVGTKNQVSNRSDKHSSDILIHYDIVNTTLEKLSIPFKDFIKKNSKKMKEVLIR